MIRYALAVLCTSLLPFAGASGQSEELNAAIDAYLHEDYSHIDVVARYAEQGVPEALAVLGQAYLYGYGLETDRPLGVALLEQAASLGERSSAVHLGRVFEFGVQGIPVDAEAAAKWYVMAARAGDTRSAPAALKRLPPETVIAAGGAAWAGETSPAPDTPPSNKGEASAIDAGAGTQTAAATPQASPAGDILGTASAPPPLIMNDQTRFPLYADTRLSAVGDASASCFVILKPELERRRLAMESLMKLDGNGGNGEARRTYEALAEADRQITEMSKALRASESVLADPARNGGLGPEDVRMTLIPHREAHDRRLDSGPGVALCTTRLVQLIGESAAWSTP